MWVVQQLREGFPYESAARFLNFDHDANDGTEVPAAIRSIKISSIRAFALRSRVLGRMALPSGGFRVATAIC